MSPVKIRRRIRIERIVRRTLDAREAPVDGSPSTAGSPTVATSGDGAEQEPALRRSGNPDPRAGARAVDREGAKPGGAR